PAGHAPAEDELDLIGAANVEVFADDLFEEDAAGDGLVEDLGEGGLRLQDGGVVPVAGFAGGGGVGGRGAGEPHAGGGPRGGGGGASHLRASAAMRAAESPSHRAWARRASAQVRRPLSRASKAMPARVSWRLRYSCPLTQSLPV